MDNEALLCKTVSFIQAAYITAALEDEGIRSRQVQVGAPKDASVYQSDEPTAYEIYVPVSSVADACQALIMTGLWNEIEEEEEEGTI
ncbi:MAG: hypothetical protein IJI10_01495 [Eubacterium sp.]|nr:hypothetical protein [Eubacterium sp.]